MTVNNIDQMIRLLKAKKESLDEILKLTRKQSHSIEREDMSDLHQIISDKDKLMQEVDAMDLKFLSLYNRIKEEEDIDSLDKIDASRYANLGKLKKIVGELNGILEDISLIDRKNTDLMKKNLEDIKSGLRHVKEVKKAYKGYNYESNDSILIDEKK